jgi:hypothetical protein
MRQHIHVDNDIVDLKVFGDPFTPAKISHIDSNLMAFRIAEILGLNIKAEAIKGSRQCFGIFFLK